MLQYTAFYPCPGKWLGLSSMGCEDKTKLLQKCVKVGWEVGRRKKNKYGRRIKEGRGVNLSK